MMLIGFLVSSCLSKEKVISKLDDSIWITKTDSLKFKKYIVLDFKSNQKRGKILVEKSKPRLINVLNSGKIKWSDLQGITSFKLDDDLTLRGHLLEGGRFYVDEKLEIDTKQYYELKTREIPQDKFIVNVQIQGEPLIGVSIFDTEEPVYGGLTDINGRFEMEMDLGYEAEFIVSQCCGCFGPGVIIKKESNVHEVEIDCRCNRKGAKIEKRYIERGKMKKRISRTN